MSNARETIPQVVDAMRRTADQLDVLAAMTPAAGSAAEMLRGFADRVAASMVNADRFPDAAREAYRAFEAYQAKIPPHQPRRFSHWLCLRVGNGGAK